MSCICEFCKGEFSAKCNLLYHQKTAKYCLKLQGKNSVYNCKTCKKELCDKRQLEKHQESCISIDDLKKLEKLNIEKDVTIKCLKDQIKQYEKTIDTLQDKLENLASQGVNKPTTTTNNILRIENLTDDWLKENAKNLTLEHIERGPQGYAEFASQHSLRNRVKCVDFSRKILQYKEDDSVVRDKKGRKLSKKFFESIQSQNKELIMEAMVGIRNEMEDKTQEELDSLIEKMNKFMDMSTIDIAKNEELKESFIRELCELL